MGVSVLPALLITLWSGLVFSLCSLPEKKAPLSQRKDFSSSRRGYLMFFLRQQLKKTNKEAQAVGVFWRDTQTITVWLLSLMIAFIFYKMTSNWLLFIVAWFAIGLLPSCLIKAKYQRQRLVMAEALVDCLRQLIANLPDQGSLMKAIEITIQGRIDDNIRLMLQEIIEEVRLGSSVEAALNQWRCQVKLRKFDSVADTLLQANHEGWTRVAFVALEKAVLALEADLLAIKTVAEKSRQRKKQLYLTTLTAWSFPFILSLLNTGSENVYLHTLFGKTLIFAYVFGTLITIIKGQEYLSLNVDEL